MNCSTSTGPSAGERVRIWTWTGVRSGMASMVRWMKDHRPMAITSIIATSVKKR